MAYASTAMGGTVASKGTYGYNSLIVACAIGVMIRVLSKDNVRTSVLYVIISYDSSPLITPEAWKWKENTVKQPHRGFHSSENRCDMRLLVFLV